MLYDHLNQEKVLPKIKFQTKCSKVYQSQALKLCEKFSISVFPRVSTLGIQVSLPRFTRQEIKNPDNYRAIAVGSCLGKTFSSILLNRLLTFRKKYCPDAPNQLGFTKGAQTNDHVLTLKTIIDKYYTKKTGKNKKLFACFVDLRKAFDNVNRIYLLEKIQSLKIEGKFFEVLSSMYNKSKAKLKISEHLSNSFRTEKGTEQGHPMSPDLFKIFIKDLSAELGTDGSYPSLDGLLINHLLWADDLVLLALDEHSLQKNLDELHKFCDTWDLEINAKKTKIINFGRKTSTKFHVGDYNIEITDQYCYLGIVFHKNGKLAFARNDLRKKALRSLYGLKRYVHRDYISLNSLIILFDTLIKPVLLYGCQIITPHSPITKHICEPYSDDTLDLYLARIYHDIFEKFHIKFLKWCLGVHSKASNIGVYGETAHVPLIFDATKLSIDYFLRCADLPDTTITKRAYNEQKTLNLDWFKYNTAILNKFNTGIARHPSVNCYKNLRDQFVKTWEVSQSNSTKLEFYRNIKSDFVRSKYLNLSEFPLRSYLTKLLISAHDLEIERGRYTNSKAQVTISRENRHCRYCKEVLNTEIVESESHFLDSCPLYSVFRNKLVHKLNITDTDSNIVTTSLKFNIENNDEKNLFSIANYCKSSFEHRTAFLEYLDSYNN